MYGGVEVNRLNRCLSSILVLALLLSIAVVPGYAGVRSTFGVTLEATSDSAGKTPVEYVKSGDTFYVYVRFSGNSQENNVCAFDLYISYDNDLITVSRVIGMGPCSSASTNANKNGHAFINWASEKGLVESSGFDETLLETGNLAALQCVAAADLDKSDLAKFSIVNDETSKSFFVNSEKDELEYTEAPLALPVLAPNSILVYSDADTTIAAPIADDEGWPQSETVEYKSIVTDESGTIIDSDTITWSVSGSPKGVTVNGGIVTVTSEAGRGNYTINAESGDKTGSATLTVTKEESAPSRIQGKEPGEDFDPNLYIPADNAADKTVQFSIYVWDQYGVEMADPDVKWKLSPSDVPGVSLSNNGLLTITNDAKNSSIDTTGTKFTINAYCGELGPVATDVTVKRADSVATSVEIYKGEEVVTSDSITVPTGDISNTVTYTAKVFDQYGTEITNASVTWNTEGSVPSGVTVANDTVTVQKGATTGNFTLKAASGNIKAPLTVNVVTIAFSGQDAAVTTEANPTYGMTWGEIVNVDDSMISASVGEQPVTGTYTVQNADDIPAAGEQTYTVLFNGGDYTNVVVKTGTVNIAPKTVAVSGITAENKVYDGDTDATIITDGATISDIVSGDNVTIDVTGATGTFDNKNVGTGKTVTIIDITLGGNDAGNYTLATVTATGNITAKELTADVSGVSVTKEYDGTTAAGTVSGAATAETGISGETVTVKVSAGEYADKNVGNDKSVTLTLSLSGDNAGNYTLSNTTATATASITPSSSITDATATAQTVVVGVGTFTEPKFTGVTVNGVAETVEGTVTYTIDGTSGMSYEDAVSAIAKEPQVGSDVEVGYSFTSTNANYVDTAQTGTIIVTIVNIVFDIEYGAITVVDLTPEYGTTWGEIIKVDADKITAKVGNDTIEDGAYTVKYADVMPNAGLNEWEVLFSGTFEGKTYTDVLVEKGNATFVQKELTITGLSVENKEYDGNTTASVTGDAVLNGLLQGDTVTVNTGKAEFTSADAGENIEVTFSDYSITGSSALNYTLKGQPDPVTATIRPKPVTITGVTAEDKDYDGTKTATPNTEHAQIDGIISGDTVNIKAGTGTFASADVGTGITVTFSGFSLTGADSSNYTLSAQPASTTADIAKGTYTGTPNTVNVNILINQSAAQTGSVSLDQFFQAVPAGAAITGVTSTNDNVIDDTVISEDGKEITYTSKANLTTEDAKDTYTVTIETKNYNDIEATLIFTTIAKTPVNITGVSVTGAGKTYDGKAVSYSGTPVAKTNDGTEVPVTGTYSYAWQKADGAVLSAAPKDAGSYKLVITLDDPAYIGSAEVSFTIAKAKITITAEDAEAYTGSDMPKLSYTVTGLASGESLAVEPTLSCAADMRKAGSYEIEVSGAAVPDTANYVEAITYVSGVLTVKDRPINIGPVYDITVLKSDHGTVKASLSNASEGSTIRLTVTPDEGYSLYSITVRAENGKLIDVSKSGGVYSFKMPASAVTVQASFVKGTMKLPFNDVSTYDWFYDAVMYAYSNGIMNGLDTNVFGPNETTTRAMLVTMLYRAAGEPAVRGTNTFRDVAANTWYTDAIIWASTNGIVTGVDDGLFNPNGAITREQLATILYRYAKYVGDDVSASASLAGFTDAGSISDYAKDAMSWAVAAGLFEGRDNGKLEPTGTATRAEIATVFMRHFG